MQVLKMIMTDSISFCENTFLYMCVYIIFFPQGELTGLCGNFDLKTVNELRTPDNFELTNSQEFGNSWTAVEVHGKKRMYLLVFFACRFFPVIP